MTVGEKVHNIKLPNKRMIISLSTIIIIVIVLMIIVQEQYKNGIKQEVASVAVELGRGISNASTIKKPLYNQQTEQVQIALGEMLNYARASSIIVTDNNLRIVAATNSNIIGDKYIKSENLTIDESSLSKDGQEYSAQYMTEINFEGQIIGSVIVTTSSEIISPHLSSYQYYFKLMAVAIVIMLLTIISTIHLVFHKSFFNLSSKDVALLITENELMKETFKTGIIVLDLQFNVIEINENAKKIFELQKTDTGYKLGKNESQLYKKLKQVINHNNDSYNMEYKTQNNQRVICSFKGLYNNLERQVGVVIMIRNTTEFSELAEELMGVKMLTDDLRAQNHEFLNKLHVISGLIQLGETDQVVNYISELTEEKQDLIGVLAKNISDVYVSGILLAKYSKAVEAKIDFIIDSESNISKVPESIGIDRFCSIIGNLLENSIDELRGKENGRIYIKISEDSQELRIIIEDNGRGIPEYLQKNIFERGISTKSGQRGYGLWIVREAIYDANGTIDFISNSNGTRWEILLY
jgi:two-component system CitB family sensor kinase